MYTQQAALLLAQAVNATDVAREPSTIDAPRREARRRAGRGAGRFGLLARVRRPAAASPEATCSEA